MRLPARSIQIERHDSPIRIAGPWRTCRTWRRRHSPPARQLPPLSEAEKATSLAKTMMARPPGPLYVFGYGSLIWNPCFEAREFGERGPCRMAAADLSLDRRSPRLARGARPFLRARRGRDGGLSRRGPRDLGGNRRGRPPRALGPRCTPASMSPGGCRWIRPTETLPPSPSPYGTIIRSSQAICRSTTPPATSIGRSGASAPTPSTTTTYDHLRELDLRRRRPRRRRGGPGRVGRGWLTPNGRTAGRCGLQSGATVRTTGEQGSSAEPDPDEAVVMERVDCSRAKHAVAQVPTPDGQAASRTAPPASGSGPRTRNAAPHHYPPKSHST